MENAIVYLLDSMKVTLGRNLEHYRKRIRLNQDALAAKSGVSASTISLVERGKVWPEYGNIVALAEALEVPDRALFGVEAPAKVTPSPEEALEVIERLVQNRHKQPASPSFPVDGIQYDDLILALRQSETVRMTVAESVKTFLISSARNKSKPDSSSGS